MFDRKNYYYPDLPKGFQITQMTKPCGIDGYLDIDMEDYTKRVYIHQLHLEEDTASLDHYNTFSLIDYNRSGIPLMEIVTEPCIESSDEAVRFLEVLRNIFIYLGVSEADSKKGQMRCDVNVSLKEEDATELGTKVEMKNINSFSNVKAAIEYEIKRQNELLDKGEKIVQETIGFSDEDGKTYSMREKVDAIDYKYFIEPNIPPVKVTKEFLDEIRSEIPKLELERQKEYTEEYGLSLYDAKILVKDKDLSDYFEDIIREGIDPTLAANWVIGVVSATLNKLEIELKDFFITSTMLANVIKLVKEDKISEALAKKTLYEAIEIKKDPMDIIKDKNLGQIKDDNVLSNYVKEAVDENPIQVEQYIKEGKDYVKNFFVGKVMAKTNRQADPKLTLELIVKELESRR